MAAAMRELQQQLEAEVNALRSLEKDISRNHKVRRQYSLQLNENEMVQKELDLLEEDARVFKLIGPVLVPQDPSTSRFPLVSQLEPPLASPLQELELLEEDARVFKLIGPVLVPQDLAEACAVNSPSPLHFNCPPSPLPLPLLARSWSY
ncbi:unnamed protein product [Closterium sp. Naga37s-1]|nr:unnamed protein product [Closterium sp. Naga37s-1]